MAPKDNESTLLSSLLKEMSNLQEQIWTSACHPNGVGSGEAIEESKGNNNNNSNDLDNSNNNKVENTEKSFWQRTSELMEKMEEEMKSVTGGKDVRFIEREDLDDQVKLRFELIGLTSEEIRISTTATNFIEIEYMEKDDNEDPSCIWAYPLEQGLKVGEMSYNFTENGQQLIISVPKDPDFQEVEEEEEQGENSDETDWICPLTFWPFAEAANSDGDDPVQVVQPIEANIEENEDQFKIEMKIEGFQADEINVRLCQNRVLNVAGERKNRKPDEEENKIARKSFGRMFWIPEGGCKKEEITAKTRIEDSILILTIIVPKGGESASTDNEETRQISIQQQ